MTSSSPKVSVLMPVYNGEKFLRESMDSVLGQTFTDFEFLIIDDGSTDDSVAIIQSYADTRICFVRNNTNLGVVNSLNRGLTLCRSEYIARMDSDDVCLPSRLEVQVAFMEANPNVGICGSWIGSIGSSKIWRMPVTHSEITVNLLLNSAFAHSSVMIRKSLLTDNDLHYSDGHPHAEDFALWVQAASLCYLANIPEVLLMYRVHGDQVSQSYSNLQMNSAGRIRSCQLERIGARLTDLEKLTLDEIGSGQPVVTPPFLTLTFSAFQKILRGNLDSKYLDQAHLRRFFSRVCLNLCLQCQGHRLWVFFQFSSSKLVFRFPKVVPIREFLL